MEYHIPNQGSLPSLLHTNFKILRAHEEQGQQASLFLVQSKEAAGKVAIIKQVFPHFKINLVWREKHPSI